MNNETINNKRAMFLDMQEHPERYSNEQIEALLADEDIKAFAETLAIAKRAMTKHEPNETDVDKAWQRFAKSHKTTHHNRLKIAAVTSGVIFLSGMAWAAAVQLGWFRAAPEPADVPQKPHTEQTLPADTLRPDSIKLPKDSMSMAPVTFDNAELATVLNEMATFYQVEVVFRQESSRHIRLYFQWDKHLDLQQQIDLLNGFDRINISLQDQHLNVE